MKISELIALLEQRKEEYGDVDVRYRKDGSAKHAVKGLSEGIEDEWAYSPNDSVRSGYKCDPFISIL